MLDIIFIIIFLFNIILMIYSIQERRIALVFTTAVIWLTLALFIIQGIEIPYEMYNATSGNIETGTHNIQTNLTPLAYLFIGFAVVMFSLFATYTLEAMYDYKKIR